ncbi:hypothetical protein JL720_1089 [Aureococcus anophagefferens]|nr:hypothetical protein JL720_1089 [Aureococcus anophagefferens]
MEGLDEFGAQQLHKAARAAEGAVDARAPSGDAAADPAILVWDVETLVVQHRLGDGWFKAAALLVFFSPDAEALVAVDADTQHSLGYWRLGELRRRAELRRERRAAQAAGEAAAHWSGVGDADEAGSALAAAERTPAAERRAEVFEPPAIYDGCWLFEDGDHAEADVDEDAARAGTATPSFATVGPGRHVKFWFAEADGAGSWLVRSVAGSWLPEFATTAMHRCVFLREPRLLLTGGGDGRVYAWRGRPASRRSTRATARSRLNLSRDGATPRRATRGRRARLGLRRGGANDAGFAAVGKTFLDARDRAPGDAGDAARDLRSAGAGRPRARRLTEQRWAALGGLRGGGKRLLAVGADVGDLRVLAAPACVQNAPAREASAHGSRCAAVRWLSGFAREGDDVVARLATAGGHDRCLLQWKVVRLDVAKTQDAAASARAKKRWSVAASRVKLIGASKVAAVPRKGGSKMALCFMCGALNPAATFANHRRTCASRWAKARDAAKKRNLPDDDDDPGPLPPDPHAGVDFSRLDLAALEVANDASQAVYFAHALAECEHCKRRFKKPALRKHRRACTAPRPFAPPIARRPKDRGAAPAAWL